MRIGINLNDIFVHNIYLWLYLWFTKQTEAMKAIIDNGTTYKVTSERGSFTYTEDNGYKYETAGIKCETLSADHK